MIKMLRIAEFWSTLDQAINYLKNNIDNKDKKEKISVLINALNSIENALTKIKDEKETINEIKNIKKSKLDFNELKKAFQTGNLDKCKKILK